MTLRIEGNDRHAAVFDGRRQLTGMAEISLAERQLERIQRARNSRPRPCLCCGKTFVSTGPGHRMCGPCRNAAKRALA